MKRSVAQGRMHLPGCVACERLLAAILPGDPAVIELAPLRPVTLRPCLSAGLPFTDFKLLKLKTTLPQILLINLLWNRFRVKEFQKYFPDRFCGTSFPGYEKCISLLGKKFKHTSPHFKCRALIIRTGGRTVKLKRWIFVLGEWQVVNYFRER